MEKFIAKIVARPMTVVLGILIGLIAVEAAAAVTVVLTGPSTYTSSQWTSVCISNKDGNPNYRANIEVCPSSSNPAVPGACSTTQIEVASLPTAAQTIVNYMITQWCTAHPGYCT